MLRIFEKREITQTIPNESYAGLGLTNLLNQNTIASIPDLSLSSVFAAVEIISNSVAELPINVKTKSDNKTDIVYGHNLYNVFNSCIQTKYMLIKMMVVDMLLYGNGLAYIKRDANGVPTELVYCEHGSYNIHYDKMTKDLYYTITGVPSGRVEPINVIHLIKNSKDGVNGVGILTYAKNTLELSKYTEKTSKEYFSSNCHLAGVLSTESRINTAQQREQIRDSWLQANGNNGSRIAVLEYGMKYQPVSSNAKEAQMLESRLFNLQEVARFFSINPVLLGDLTHSSYSTIEASLLEFVMHTLEPYIILIENELTRKLILPSEKALYIDLDDNFILKSDKQSQANYLTTLKNAGIITINEARQQLGLNPIDGGDVLMVNYTNIDNNIINKDKKEGKEPEDQDKNKENEEDE